MALIVTLLIIALIILAHWCISRTRLYPVALTLPIIWFFGSLGYMVHEHSFDARGIAASLGGTIFLFGMWGSGVDHYKKHRDHANE